MALLRNLIIWACLLSPSISFAERIPLTSNPVGTTVPVEYWHIGSQYRTSSPEATCALMQQTLYPNGSLCSPTYYNECRYKMNAADYCRSDSSQRVCPAGTANGANFTCVTTQLTYNCPSTGGLTLSLTPCPDCVSPQVRDSQTGLCVAPPCTAGAAFSGSVFAGWRVGPGPNQIVGADGGAYIQPPSMCNGTCAVDVTISGCHSDAAPYVNTPQPITCNAVGTETGATCGSNNMAVPSTPPTIPNHRPKCLATEGVLTSSSGTVACVPSGTPASVPVVRTETQTQQFPDGSSKVIETTYTKDPVTQVQDTQQTITNTPASGGGTGTAGTPGTTSSSGSTQPSSGTDPDASDFCQKNGQLQICKGDMNLESTQKEVRDYIKSLTDPAATGYTAIENAKQSAQADADLQTEIDKFTSATDGTYSPNAASKSSWENAMSSGWFEPVTRQGCSPYTAQIGGRTWTLDICPTAEKISVISEYVLWFLLVVGTFVMLTGGVISRSS